MELKLKDICHSYDQKTLVLQNINLVLSPGIYGLVGPNGAGKSTLIRIISQSLNSSSGSVLLDEKERDDTFKKVLGYMPQSIQGFSKFKVKQFLYYIASLKGMNRHDAQEEMESLISMLELSNLLDRKMEELSGGMRQRVLFAQSLLNNPQILVLDEPTAGLDPFERIRLRNLISKVSKQKIVLIATHVMQDIEAIANTVLFLNAGSIVFEGSVSECLDSFRASEAFVKSEDIESFQLRHQVSRLYQHDNGFVARTVSLEGELTPDLDDAYLFYLVNQNEI